MENALFFNSPDIVVDCVLRHTLRPQNIYTYVYTKFSFSTRSTTNNPSVKFVLEQVVARLFRIHYQTLAICHLVVASNTSDSPPRELVPLQAYRLPVNPFGRRHLLTPLIAFGGYFNGELPEAFLRMIDEDDFQWSRNVPVRQGDHIVNIFERYQFNQIITKPIKVIHFSVTPENIFPHIDRAGNWDIDLFQLD